MCASQVICQNWLDALGAPAHQVRGALGVPAPGARGALGVPAPGARGALGVFAPGARGALGVPAHGGLGKKKGRPVADDATEGSAAPLSRKTMHRVKH